MPGSVREPLVTITGTGFVESKGFFIPYLYIVGRWCSFIALLAVDGTLINPYLLSNLSLQKP